MDLFQSPQLMVNEDGEPRIIDTIFNVTGIVNNLFNTSNNALVTYVGGLVLFIVLLGRKLKHYIHLTQYILHITIFRTCPLFSGCILQSDIHIFIQ